MSDSGENIEKIEHEQPHTREADKEILDGSVFGATSAALKGTLEDYKERWIEFESKDGVPSIKAQGIGPEINLEGNEVVGGRVYSDIELYERRIYQKKIELVYHTHPAVSPQYLRDRGVVNITSPYGTVDSESAAYYCRVTVPRFSSADLTFLKEYAWFINKMMIGTEFGYRLLIPANSIGVSNLDEVGYETECNQVEQELLKTIAQGGLNDTEKEVLQTEVIGKFDKILKKYADRAGITVFGNNSYEDPVLKKL